MKVFSSTCNFEYSWDEVSTANWRKYCPWNDKATHVVGVDTLSRTIDPNTGIVSPIPRGDPDTEYEANITSLLLAPNRASHHLQPVGTVLGLFPLWRRRRLPRLRDLLRRPGVQEGHHVLHQPDLVKCPQRPRDGRVSAILSRTQHHDAVHPGSQDHRSLWRLAKDQEQGRGGKRGAIPRKCQAWP